MKVFLNICHSPLVPAPPIVDPEEVLKAIKAEDTAYRVPLSLSGPRNTMDKSKTVSLVFDACINTQAIELSKTDPDFQLFIIELAIEWIEEKHKMKLSRGLN
jgi:hypothetical protein